jgi:GT2 family glycosyltransferase
VTSRPPIRSVSVVIPVRDGAVTLSQQLAAVADQQLDVPWEVIVVDHGSRDGSGDLARRWASSFRALKVVPTGGPPGVAHARNAGAAIATGDLVALCDADDVVTADWLAALVDAAADLDVVGGRLVPVGPELDGLADDGLGDDGLAGLPSALDFLPYAVGANCAIRREVIDALHGWDEAYVAGADDVEMSWRAQLAGYRIGYAPDAVVWHRARPTARATARQAFRYGVLDHRLYRDFRDRGLPRPALREGVRAWAWIVTSAADAVRVKRRHRWLGVVAHRTGRLAGSLRYRQLML